MDVGGGRPKLLLLLLLGLRLGNNVEIIGIGVVDWNGDDENGGENGNVGRKGAGVDVGNEGRYVDDE